MSGAPVPVFVAVGPAWVQSVLAALSARGAGLVTARRCDDLADLLASAATGQARCVVLSAELPGLDRDALLRLAASGVAPVALVSPGDERAERWLRQLGVRCVLPADSPPSEVAAAVRRAVSSLAGDQGGYGDPSASLHALFAPALEVVGEAGHGRVVAVWGPTGAPGRTTVAQTLAAELAHLGWPTLLADADVYGGTVAAALGLPDEASGFAAVCRLANSGALDVPRLAGYAEQASPNLRVLTGLSRAERWAELRPGSVQVVLDLARTLAAVTVVDCGFCLEQDEELSYDTLAPRRNGATFAVLEHADLVLVVGSADPVGLQRLVRGLGDLRDAVPGARAVVVVNRSRPGALPGDPEAEVRAVLSRYAGVQPLAVVPADVPGLDAAFAAARPLTEVAPTSPARVALQALAADLVGPRAPERRRRSLLRR
jgi:MinD-like ATPase involved in chromosome partitioning or flagellar assembly